LPPGCVIAATLAQITTLFMARGQRALTQTSTTLATWFSLKREHVKAAHKNSVTTPLRQRRALALSAKLVEWAMTEDTKKFLAALTTLTNNALKSLQEFRGGLDTLSSRIGEIEGLEQRGAAAKQRLNEVKAQLQATESEMEEMKQSHAKLSAELSVPATALHELRTMLRDVKPT
jgi:hypothetical protein